MRPSDNRTSAPSPGGVRLRSPTHQQPLMLIRTPFATAKLSLLLSPCSLVPNFSWEPSQRQSRVTQCFDSLTIYVTQSGFPLRSALRHAHSPFSQSCGTYSLRPERSMAKNFSIPARTCGNVPRFGILSASDSKPLPWLSGVQGQRLPPGLFRRMEDKLPKECDRHSCRGSLTAG